MMYHKSFILLTLSVLTGVHAHGGIYNYTIGDPPSIHRRWFPDPIQDINHPYLSCNRGNHLATRNPVLHAPIRAGENITAF
ncbi:e6170bc5-a860-407a-acba-305ebef80abe [Thermothielavioides terrestris]|uniref:Glycoside hydrolase family 61 protein n=2 Tax=Thermothielavioides terrestris TaxID=2587410 RepID=G2QWF1_THETT|nr:glycoside hydrolase family 61 protein [Thermothielavioides terrestris NRRL 8126]AEO63926.1 glycoside hydrolase family 61 protein [Thermothielavioides terrestris NRRL 8126]SPQ23342.1 e6170bc5-a860-407a-acba-305ebef80abe [Thermothielavioides terrestris]